MFNRRYTKKYNNKKRGYRTGATLNKTLWTRKKRVNQNLTRNVFWFKETGPLQVQTTGANQGEIFQRYAPSQVATVQAFVRFAYSYEQYKVLKMVVKWIPASVGSEAVNPEIFHRGNICTWIDQPPIEVNPPNGINDVMSRPSCKLHQPRRTMIRWMNRPRGGRFLDWGRIEHTQGGAPGIPQDSWDSQIKIYGDNFGFGNAQIDVTPYYYVEIWYKVIFRSRYTN